jgi:hypothetical protein
MTGIAIRGARIVGLADLEFIVPKPSITSWQRLEANPYDLDLAAALEAQIADPLWLIGRQWQFGELRGEDAGTPIAFSASVSSLPVGFDGGAPEQLLEPMIEAEPAEEAVPALAGQAGLDLASMLKTGGHDEHLAAFRSAFPFAIDRPDPGVDAAGARLAVLVGSTGIHAVKLAEALERDREADGSLRLPSGVQLGGADPAPILAILADWLEDWSSLFVRPVRDSWTDETLGYDAKLSVAGSFGTSRNLVLKDYTSGRLDWHAFTADIAGTLDLDVPPPEDHRIPLPVRFTGMAADRLFEFEDAAVNFGPASLGPTGLLSTLLIEYVLSSSNDWYQVPLSLPYGHAHVVRSMSVGDTFGIAANPEPAARGSAGWSMFEVTSAGDGSGEHSLFVMPGVTAESLEGAPIDEIAMFRDELANLAWAVERKVPGVTLAAVAKATEPRTIIHRALDGPAPDAAFIYRMQTATPTNWYPLTAEGDAGVQSLRVRRMRFAFADGSDALQDPPQGRLLRLSDEQPMEIREQSLPRSGLVLTRGFQMARDPSGRRFVWLGRRRKVGGGEGVSTLRFDALEPIASPE